MKLALLTACLMACLSVPALAASTDTAKPFSLPTLPYQYGALDPVISAKTMETHYTKHHQGYVDKLNAEVAKDKKLQGKSLEDIFKHASTAIPAVRNNAGGHWNHSFFWNVMSPPPTTGEPSPELAAAITKNFGSMDEFKAAFEKAGNDRFGSGWVWLIVAKGGKLAVTSTPNQDNPLMNDAPVKGTPLLANDVWEHAYYLTYQNKRAEYLSKWWDVVNWTQVSKNYAAATAKK